MGTPKVHAAQRVPAGFLRRPHRSCHSTSVARAKFRLQGGAFPIPNHVYSHRGKPALSQHLNDLFRRQNTSKCGETFETYRASVSYLNYCLRRRVETGYSLGVPSLNMSPSIINIFSWKETRLSTPSCILHFQATILCADTDGGRGAIVYICPYSHQDVSSGGGWPVPD